MSKAQGRAQKAAQILSDMINAASAAGSVQKAEGLQKAKKYDSLIPAMVMTQAKCIVVLPSVKTIGYSAYGMRYGAGVASCKVAGDNGSDGWSQPVFVKLTGGKYGAQIGYEATDLVLVFADDDAVQTLSKHSLKLGAEVSVAAGPVGRDLDVETNGHFQDQVLSYSHSKGLYAGISVNGGDLYPDKKVNEKIYGKNPNIEALLKSKVDGESFAAPVRDFFDVLKGLIDVSDLNSDDDGDSS